MTVTENRLPAIAPTSVFGPDQVLEASNDVTTGYSTSLYPVINEPEAMIESGADVEPEPMEPRQPQDVITSIKIYLLYSGSFENYFINAYPSAGADPMGTLCTLDLQKDLYRLAQKEYKIFISSSTSPVDLGGLFAADLTAKQEHTRNVYKDYSNRIEVLHRNVEDDGFGLSEASERDFWQYIRSTPFAQKAGLVLVDNGNLRAVWKGDDESHLGIQFLGNQWVEYVIFKRRPSTRHVARVAGHDTLDGVKRLIDAFDLTSLMGT